MRFAYLIEPPFNYIDDLGRVTGCDVELARHVFQELGIVDFELVQTEFFELLPGLTDDRWRMTTGLFETEERRQNALFSRPIWALPDGLLVRAGNPLKLSGYKSLTENRDTRLAVIRDQYQHRTAVEFGIDENRIAVFDTYRQAAKAVRDGKADAYASVGRAHSGFIRRHPEWAIDLVLVPQMEKSPAFGSFAFNLEDTALLGDVDSVLSRFLGTEAHGALVAPFGFSSEEIELVSNNHS